MVGIICLQAVLFLTTLGWMPRNDVSSSEAAKPDGMKTINQEKADRNVLTPEKALSLVMEEKRTAHYPPPAKEERKGDEILTEPRAPGQQLGDMRKLVQQRNAEHKILNVERFGPVEPHDVVVVVQVHKRLRELTLFLSGLEMARNASSILLVVSMDYVTPELDNLVLNITFCRVRSSGGSCLQIRAYTYTYWL